MSKSIPLSQKHGLNPCMSLCFFCGETKNEIALLGKLRGDAEAPRSVLLDYEPCDSCKEKMSQGITLIGATEQPSVEGQPAIVQGMFPTGRWLVVSEDFIKRNMDVEFADLVLEKRKALVDDVIIREIQDSTKQEV